MNIFLQKIYDILARIFLALADKVIVEPDRPNKKYPAPDVVRVKGVKYKKRGRFRTATGKAKGVVVHYTVSGNTDASARAVVRSLAARGLGCLVMDADGIIYAAEDYDFEKEVVYHAGSSSWKGATGISRYCIGMEICNWGRLTPESKKRVTKLRRSNGEANIKPGEYEPYTKEQEESLVNFILWYAQQSEEFDVDWVVGHDEIAPTRKTDPGASLSMSMPKFREYIARRIAEG